MVLHRRVVVGPLELHFTSRLKDISYVVEPAYASGILPLVRHGQYELHVADDAKITADWIAGADIVPGPQGAITIAANAVRAAGEIVEVGRQRGGTAQRRAVIHRRVKGQQIFPPYGHVLQVFIVKCVITNVARRQRYAS